eukprot:gb/GECG01002063.1/.p1 GENE.gb/GECG01002063.1/~~gb/GECG01002063.1/.p1  ORF type:complete len:573 (+),score=63.75 gb/GECG01002063.1/:1-1719(+)
MGQQTPEPRRLNKRLPEQFSVPPSAPFSSTLNASISPKKTVVSILSLVILVVATALIWAEVEWVLGSRSSEEYYSPDAGMRSVFSDGSQIATPSMKSEPSRSESTGNKTSTTPQAKATNSTAANRILARTQSYEPASKVAVPKSEPTLGKIQFIRTFSFPQENMPEYLEAMKPARVLADRANLLSQNMEDLHTVAGNMDATRTMLPPNAVSPHIPIPKALPLEFHRRRHDNFLWGTPAFREKFRVWQQKRCVNDTKRYANATKMDARFVSIKSTEALLQRSFQLENVTYNDELREPIFSLKGKVLEYPYCDLRKCPQERYPFIYLLVPHRNRVGNLLRFVSSVRNATLRCDEPPPWYHCLCIYVSDYDTDRKTSLASELEYAWRDRVRLLSRSPATYHWIKTQTYNSALRYIPTPSIQSLVFHVDADLVAMDSSFVDRGLDTTTVGKKVSFPKVMGTKSSIQDGDRLFEHAVTGTLMNNENSWVRDGGYGMTWFYLFDDNVGFFGSTINKTTWGGEDNLFYVHFWNAARKRQMQWPPRYKEESLWHIWHNQFMNWQKSKDGISIDRSTGRNG